MEKHTPKPRPDDNQRYNVIRLRHVIEQSPVIKKGDRGVHEQHQKIGDQAERESELKKLEAMRAHFIAVASNNEAPLKTKSPDKSLVSRLLRLVF